MIGKINWHPQNRDLRKFGWVILVGFGILGTLLYFKHKVNSADWMWGIGGFVGLLAVIFPSAARPFYFIWMGIGFALGSVMSRVVMTIIFYGVISPVALFFRMIKRDALRIRSENKSRNSYWENLPPADDPTSYDHLY